MFCSERTVRSDTRDGITLVGLACRCWTCDYCYQQRLRELRDIAADGNPSTFITLTVHPDDYYSPDLAARALSHAWRMIRQAAARDGYADKIPFLAVFETTRRGWPHLHILARTPYLPQRWLSQRAHAYGVGRVCDIRRVWNRRHASRYIAKYVSKAPHRFSGVKRYWRSQDYSEHGLTTRAVADSSRRWECHDGDLNHHIAVLQFDGYHVIERTERRAELRYGAGVERGPP